MCLDNFEEWSASVEALKVAAARKPYIDPARVTPTCGPYWVTGAPTSGRGMASMYSCSVTCSRT
jgi:hypothetical protein